VRCEKGVVVSLPLLNTRLIVFQLCDKSESGEVLQCCQSPTVAFVNIIRSLRCDSDLACS
jgi:hypothetical protein